MVVLSRTFGNARAGARGPDGAVLPSSGVIKSAVLGTLQTLGHIPVPWVAGRLRPDGDLHHGAPRAWGTSSRETWLCLRVGASAWSLEG